MSKRRPKLRRDRFLSHAHAHVGRAGGPVSSPTRQPQVSAPPGRPDWRQRTTAGALGGGAAVAALTMTGAPWWVVAIVVALAITVPVVVPVAQVVIPQDSEHKRDLWLELLRHRERRTRWRRARRRRSRARWRTDV